MYANHFKRAFDIAVAAAVLTATLPLSLAVAIAIWFEDRGSPLFLQTRVGQGQKPFTLIKFRSMRPQTEHVASDEASEMWVTRVGRLIRRTSLDELPQLICVLRGEMSIVGPRPALPSQVELVDLRQAMGVYEVRPGLTGLAQLRAYDAMPVHEKARFDCEYAKRVTFGRDVRILLGTLAYLRRQPPTY